MAWGDSPWLLYPGPPLQGRSVPGYPAVMFPCPSGHLDSRPRVDSRTAKSAASTYPARSSGRPLCSARRSPLWRRFSWLTGLFSALQQSHGSLQLTHGSCAVAGDLQRIEVPCGGRSVPRGAPVGRSQRPSVVSSVPRGGAQSTRGSLQRSSVDSRVASVDSRVSTAHSSVLVTLEEKVRNVRTFCMAVSQNRDTPPPSAIQIIFAENIFSPTNPDTPNRLQNISAGYMRRSNSKTRWET
jgi:hypothetical protein